MIAYEIWNTTLKIQDNGHHFQNIKQQLINFITWSQQYMKFHDFVFDAYIKPIKNIEERCTVW